MRKFNKKLCAKEADIFKALGHPTRLWIVQQLADNQEHCVCEFVEAVGDDFSTISQHLSVLKRAGVLEYEKRGKSVYYRLACPCIVEMMACVSKKKGTRP